MDSKYNLLTKSTIASTIQNIFKRKYGNGNGNVHAKKAKLQSPQKNGAPPVPAVSASTSNGSNGVSPRPQTTSIMEQKKKLPIYGVKAPYVHDT